MRPEEDKDIYGQTKGYYASDNFSLGLMYKPGEDVTEVDIGKMF